MRREEKRREEKKTTNVQLDHRLKWYLRHVHWSTWLLFVLILLFHFISYELFSHLETKQLKANNSKGNYSAKLEKPIRSKAKHKRPAQKYYVNETSNNDKQNENSNFFLFLFSHFVWCCCFFSAGFYALSFQNIQFNLIVFVDILIGWICLLWQSRQQTTHVIVDVA